MVVEYIMLWYELVRTKYQFRYIILYNTLLKWLIYVESNDLKQRTLRRNGTGSIYSRLQNLLHAPTLTVSRIRRQNSLFVNYQQAIIFQRLWWSPRLDYARSPFGWFARGFMLGAMIRIKLGIREWTRL